MRDLSELGEFAAEAIKHDTVAFVAWYRDGRIITVNERFYGLTGYLDSEVRTMRWPGDFLTRASGEMIGKCMDTMDLGERLCELDETLLRKDGSYQPVTICLNRFLSPAMLEPYYYAFISDVSPCSMADENLYLTQLALDNFTDSSIWLDSEGRIQYVNKRTCESVGYSREELLKMNISDIDPNYDRGRFGKLWLDIKAAGWLKFETLHRTKDGAVFPVEVHSSYIKFGDRELLISFDRDITERKRTEEALIESESMFRAMSETALAAVMLIQNNRFVYVNPMAIEMTGYTHEDFKHMNYWDIIHPDFKKGVKDYGDQLLRGERLAARFEVKFIRKNGEERWGDVNVGPVVYKGRMSGVVTVVDITGRKAAVLGLEESEEKFRVLSELSPTAIFMYQGETLIYANPTAEMFTGFTQEEILRKQFWEMVHPKYREMVRQYGLARQRGEKVPSQYEIQYVSKSGEIRWAQFTAGQIEYRGKPAGIVTAIDMTERKRNEIALSEAKAQAELYVDLMGHDINNMNQASLGFLEIASDKLETTGTLSGDDLPLISNAVDSLKSSSSLIDSVRKLQKEKRGGLLPMVIDVNSILAEVKDQFSAVAGRSVAISFSSDYQCRVKANELLRDVFANLVGNAIKHSRGDVTIGISMNCMVKTGIPYCRITIEDTGPGISDERKQDIFKRSVRDRTRLTGKGLGLYLVRTLIDDFKGEIWVEDRVPGDYTKGARFVVLLPVSDEGPESSPGEARA